MTMPLPMDNIMETVNMIQNENLDVRTITMGISLLDCADSDIDLSCRKIYDKILRKADHLVKTGEKLSDKYGIPIVNKRVAVTPISMLAGVSGGDPVKYARVLDKAAHEIGIDFIGGFSALVHRGFSAGDRELIEAIPQALAETELVCSSVNIGSTKAGINMDAVEMMGKGIPQNRGTDQGPAVHRRREAGGILQRSGRQPFHGRRFSRCGKCGLLHQHRCFRTRRSPERASAHAGRRADGQNRRSH
jgi:uncharacterized protein (UPF0210 family)